MSPEGLPFPAPPCPSLPLAAPPCPPLPLPISPCPSLHVSQVALTLGSPWRLSGVRGLHLGVQVQSAPRSAGGRRGGGRVEAADAGR